MAGGDVAALPHLAIDEQSVGRSVDVVAFDQQPGARQRVVEELARRGLMLGRYADSGQGDRDLRSVAIDDDRLSVDGADEADHAGVCGGREEEDEGEMDEDACDSIHSAFAVLTHGGRSRGIDAHSVWRGGR